MKGKNKMKDKFKKVYENQFEFNKKFLKDQGLDIDNLSKKDFVDRFKDYSLHLIKEITEAINTLNFKMHRIENKEDIKSNTTEELIDCLKFLLGLFNLCNVDYDNFVHEYWRKTNVVEQRYIQEHRLDALLNNSNVVALDLDGVLCQYPMPWVNYINLTLNRLFDSLLEVKKEVDVVTYEKLKSDYRQCGIKKSNKPVKDASKLTILLKRYGYHIVVLTSRPYKKYYRLYADTLEWLNNNDIKYDTILFDEQKNITIVKMIPKLKFMVEDNVDYANDIASLNYKVYLISSEINEGKECHENVIRVNDLESIINREKLF